MFNFLRSKGKPTITTPEFDQAIIFYIPGEGFDRMSRLSEKLDAQLESSDLGMFDGNEIGGGETILFIHTHDAERLYAALTPAFAGDPDLSGARLVIRSGGPGSPQREVQLYSTRTTQ